MNKTKEKDNKKIVILITSDRIGHGSDDFGSKLMTNFIGNLKEMGPDLWRLIFLNNGVKLTIEDSETLSALKELEADGLVLLVCTTCLKHFNLLEKKQVGTATNMPDIITAMQYADKMITL